MSSVSLRNADFSFQNLDICFSAILPSLVSTLQQAFPWHPRASQPSPSTLSQHLATTSNTLNSPNPFTVMVASEQPEKRRRVPPPLMRTWRMLPSRHLRRLLLRRVAATNIPDARGFHLSSYSYPPFSSSRHYS